MTPNEVIKYPFLGSELQATVPVIGWKKDSPDGSETFPRPSPSFNDCLQDIYLTMLSDGVRPDKNKKATTKTKKLGRRFSECERTTPFNWGTPQDITSKPTWDLRGNSPSSSLSRLQNKETMNICMEMNRILEVVRLLMYTFNFQPFSWGRVFGFDYIAFLFVFMVSVLLEIFGAFPKTLTHEYPSAWVSVCAPGPIQWNNIASVFYELGQFSCR